VKDLGNVHVVVSVDVNETLRFALSDKVQDFHFSGIVSACQGAPPECFSVSDDAKLNKKTPMEEHHSIGVKFWGVSCREVRFCGSFGRKRTKFVGVFVEFLGSFPVNSTFRQ